MVSLHYKGALLSGSTRPEIPATRVVLDVADAAPIAGYAVRVLVNGADTPVRGVATPTPLSRPAGSTGEYVGTVELDLSTIPLGTVTFRETFTYNGRSYTYSTKSATIVPNAVADTDPDRGLFVRGLPARDVKLPARSPRVRSDGVEEYGDTAITYVVARASEALDRPRKVTLLGTSAEGSAPVETLPNGKSYAIVTMDLSTVAPGSYTLRSSYTEDSGRVVYTDSPVTVVAMLPEDQIRHRAGCRLPRADLKVVTGAVANDLPDITAHLVKGALHPSVSHKSHDLIVEATGKVNYTRGLIHQGSPKSAWPVYEFGSASGLERDANGVPLRMHQVNRGTWNNVKVYNFEISWTNDSVFLGSGGTCVNSHLFGHNIFDVITEATPATATEPAKPTHHQLQHRDGAQMQQGSGQTLVGNVINLLRLPAPLNANGDPVPGSEFIFMPAGHTINETFDVTGDGVKDAVINGILSGSAAFMINTNSTVGWVRAEFNYCIGGAKHFNVTPGSNHPTTGKKWYVDAFDAEGVRITGFIFHGNTSLTITSDDHAVIPKGFRPLIDLVTNVYVDPATGAVSPWKRTGNDDYTG